MSVGANGSLKAYSNEACTSEITISNNKISVDQNSTVYFKATPKTGYVVDSWTGVTVNPSDNTKASLAVGTTEATVSVSFKAPASHDITWYANGQQVAQNNQQEGATLTIPADPDPSTYCDGKTFVGWTAASTVATDGSGIIYVKSGDKVAATDKYYAVFADAGGTTSVTKEIKNLSFDAAADVTYSTGDENLIMHFLKGGAATNPGNYNNGVRLYQTGSGNSFGGYITIESTAGNITEVSFRNTGTYATSVKFSINKGTTLSDAESVAKNGTITKKDLSTKSFYLYNVGTGSSGRLEIDLITIKYGGTTYSNYTTTCRQLESITIKTNPTQSFTKGDAFTAAGLVITEHYDNGDNVDVAYSDHASDFSFSGFDMSTEGKQTVTITYKEKTITYDINVAAPSVCKAPTFSVAAGTYTGAKSVSISCGTDGATIHYTTDGTTPTASSPTYSTSIMVNQDMTLKAIAIKTDLDDSEVAEASYTINYTVTFNANGHGTAPSSITPVKYNTSISGSKPADPSEIGYTFGGWHKEQGCANVWDWTNDKVTGNITLYAKWTEKKFDIVLLNSGNQVGETLHIQEGATLGTLPTLNEESDACDPHSRTFVGWTSEEAWEGKKDNFTVFVTPSTTVNAAMTLNAVWAEEESGSNKYKKITSTDELEDGNYILAGLYSSNYYAMKNATVTGGFYMDRVVVTPAQDIITNDNANIVWKLAFNTMNNTVTFYNEALASNNYLYAYSSNKYYDLGMRTEAYNFNYSLDANTSGAWRFEASTLSGEYLTYYNNNSTKDYFNLYTSQSNPNYLFKETPNLTNYITTCSTDPLIEVSTESLNGFSTIATAGPSAAQSFMVEGYNLTENISVSAPAGYEVSSDNSNYSNSLSLTQTDGKVAKTTVYVRLAAADAAAASVAGNISLTSAGATEKNVALSGTVLAKTLQSISVKTAPTKTTYTIGEKFNPAGLVITATYNSGDETVSYADYESEFSFSPALDAELTASDNKVTITWGGKSKDQSITMQCNVAWMVNGQPWTAGTPTTKVNVGSAITNMPTDPTSEACNGKTFVGWSATTIAKTDDEPALLTKVADFTTLNDHTTYHAVFAKEGEGGEPATVFTEDFSSITSGNHTSSSGSSSSWSGNDNFNTANAGWNAVYKAGGAIRIGKSGKVTTKNLDLSAGEVTVTFKMTGWGDSEKTVSVQVGNQTAQSVSCTNSMSSTMEEKSVTFDAGTSSTAVKFTTTSSVRVFLDDIVIKCGPSVTYSEYSTTCTPVYDVNFYTDKEKTQQYGSTQKVEEGSKATAPETEPSKAGATFAGWFTANNEALADKTITEATDFIAKWNYTAPTITEQPSGGEYSIGNVVTLLVVAEPIEGVTFTYQWQRLNGSTYEDIAGETNNYYTAPTNQESQNTYRCVVTNGDASTTSNPAQVTVHPASYCAMPTIRIDELGEATAFIREATVTLECGNEGATIYYTTDGSDPKEVGANPETYTDPFKIDATKTIKAYATATDLEPSRVQTKTFTKATLQSIAVKTEPKKEYTALETFDPAGLVITANYDYSLSEEIDYANHSGEFTFTPTLTTELGVDVEAVKIGWGGKETEQQITVNCIAIDAPSVEVSKQGSTGITLTWDAVDNAASYQVKWNGGEAETATSPYVKIGLKDYTPYTYEVIAIGNTNYCTSTTGVQNITTNKKSCVSIDNAQIVKTPADFYVGESIEKSQFKVDKHYDNGDVVTEAPFNAEIEGVTNPLTDAEVGTQTVTLTFNSKTTTIEITVKPQPVVTWSINGNEDNKQSFAYNADLVLPEDDPSAPQSCAEKTFVGWTTENYKDHDSDEAPAVLFTEAGDRKVTEDVTYYAVFAMVNEVPDEVDVIDNAATVDKLGNTGTSTWVDGFTIEGSTGAKYYIRSMGTKDTDDALRFNGSGYFDASATAKSGKYLKSITINGANKKFNIFAKNEAYTSEPTGDALASITLSGGTGTYNFTDNYKFIAVHGTASSSTITSVEIVYAGVNTYSDFSTKCAARTPQSIAITHEATTTTFDVNDAFTSEGLEITAYYDSGDPQVVTGYCVITAPDMTTANEKDVNISYTENDATVNTSYKINVRQPYYVMYKPNGATTGSVPSDTKKYYTGEKVTVLANESLVKTDNVFKGWSYAGVTYQADDQITVGTENITLTAVWEEKMPCTITLSENGNISTVTDKFTGDTYNLPTTITNNVDGYAFMGWSTQEIDDPVATTEQGTFFAKGEEITLINNAYTFYAVYARTSGTSSDYNAGKVTTDADIVAGGLYIIEQADHVLSSPAAEKKAPTEATYKTSGLSATESYVWTLETSTNGFYLKNMSDNKYLKANSDGDMSSATNGPSEWVFAFQTAGYWKISAYSSSRFLGFTDANIYLYKAYSNSHYDLTKVNVQYAAQINIYRLVGGYTTAPTITVNGTTEQTVPTTFHGNVIVENVGAITLDEPTTWKNLTIKNGAKVTTNAALTIKDLLIETKMGAGTGKTNSPNMKGACGQLIIGDGGSVTASGSAIIENQIDPTGTATQGWYSFSVPFPVSAQNGIYFGETKLTNGVDYAIMEYLGDVRAQGQYGWKKYSGILQPGKMYVIAVTDSDFGKLRFKKTADGDLIATNSWTAGIYGGGDDANWNAIGNPNLAIAQFVNNSGANTLQLYDHTTNTFTGYDKSKLNIVVGSGFFIQAVKDHPNITMKVAEGDRGYRAPVEDIEEMPFVAIQLLQGEAMSDQVFLNADVNATLSYEIGRDVAKFFMQGDAKCAQIYVPAYGTNLCAAQFPLNAYDETMFPLTITAPKEGTYTIAAENVPENVDLFLEQNGALIWNLSTSAYEINLNKGETKDYSIRWNAHSSSTPTGNNSIKSDAKVQKIFYQQNIYIIQENQMYNAQGVKVQ